MTGQPAGVEPSSSKEVGPKTPPSKHNFCPAILSVISGGHFVTMGSINTHGNEDIQVAFTSKHTGTDAPYLGFHVKFRRSEDTKHLHDGWDQDFHQVFFHYLRDEYDIEHRKAGPQDKERFINATDYSDEAQNVIRKVKLYVIQFSHTDKPDPVVHGFGSSFVGANDAVNDKFNHLSSIVSN